MEIIRETRDAYQAPSMRFIETYLETSFLQSNLEPIDGGGDPEGLKGEEIPYVARIICCADCFDAMASKRVYKKAFTLETIMNEFKRCAGTQFDPDIAKVVVEMMASGKLKPYAADNTYLGDDGKWKTRRYPEGMVRRPDLRYYEMAPLDREIKQ